MDGRLWICGIAVAIAMFGLLCDFLYRLTLEFPDGKTGATRDTAVERSVGDFIDENGLICQDIVEPLVLKLHKSLSAGKKDK